MNAATRKSTHFMSQWLEVIPDRVAIFSSDYELYKSSELEKLNIQDDVFQNLLIRIKEHDFSLAHKQKIKEIKILDRVFNIEVECIDFEKEIFFYCKFIDSTELEIMTLEIQQARAQQINLARLTELAELAGGISHEISNPLTIVMAKISYLQSKLKNLDLGNDKEKIDDSLLKIIHHSNRITKIIKGLKNFSRSDENENYVTANIKDLLEEAFLLTIENIKMKGIAVDHQGLQSSLTVHCNPVQIVQVIVNLLKNSCDALEITQQPTIKIYNEIFENKIQLFFEDNGPGIPAEIQNKIFNPFFTTKPVGKGTGLGLSLSHHIIQQHGGKLFLATEKSQSCFCIELPLISS